MKTRISKKLPVSLLFVLFLLVLCLTGPIGCFYAKWYEPPEQKDGYRIFSNYLVNVYLYNENVRSFDHTWQDADYYIDAEIILDIDSTLTTAQDTTQTVRIQNLCISAPCIDYVYCPPLARDTLFEVCRRTDGEQRCVLYHWFEYGAMELTDDCRLVEATFEVVLTDVATDSILAIEKMKMPMSIRQAPIPSFLSDVSTEEALDGPVDQFL